MDPILYLFFFPEGFLQVVSLSWWKKKSLSKSQDQLQLKRKSFGWRDKIDTESSLPPFALCPVGKARVWTALPNEGNADTAACLALLWGLGTWTF